MQGPLVKLLEIARGEAHLSSPLVSQPADVLLNRVDKLLTFFLRVGVVKTEMALPTKLLSKAKIYGDRLRVTYMQKAIRLWRKPGDQRTYTRGLQISLNLCAQEVTAKLRGHPEP